MSTPVKHKNVKPHHEFSAPKDEFVEDGEFFEPKQGLWKYFSSLLISKKKIGDLNGKWATMFKIVILISIIGVPTMLSWMTWVTSNIYAAQYHQTLTEGYAARIIDLETNMKILSRVESEIGKLSVKMDNLPPPEWKRRIEILEAGRETNAEHIIALDKNNSTEHSNILVILKEINTKLEFMDNKGTP
jgi:hypothetical protein